MCSIPGHPTPGSEVHVLITRVNLNPCGLVELLVNMDDGRKHIYEQMREEIQIPERFFYGSEGKPGDLCLVSISDTWHRARIVTNQSESYNVFLIDHGEAHIVTSEALAWAHPEIFLLPPETESCILANVIFHENNRPERATGFLNDLCGKKIKGLVQHVLMPDRKILLDIPAISKDIFELGDAKTIQGEDFKCLVLKCLNLPGGEASEPKRETQEQNLNVSHEKEMKNQYLHPQLLTKTYETVTVTEVTDPQNIYCRLLIFSKAVQILSEEIQQHYQESSNCGEGQPQTIGDPCAVRDVRGKWHRSLLKQNIVTDVSDVEVMLVDEGKIELVPVKDIRPLYEEFLRMPVFTYLCSLYGLTGYDTNWTTDQTDYLKSLLLHQTFMARFDHHNIHQNVYNITLIAADATCINTRFLEKAALFPLSQTQHEPTVRGAPIPSSLLSSFVDGQCLDLQSTVIVSGDESQDQTLPVTENQETTSRVNDVPPSAIGDIQYCVGNTFTVGSSLNVKISCIESPQKFWCQPAENGDLLRLLMQDLQNHYASAHPQPLVESVCVAHNPDDGMWYRARMITSHNCPVIDVRFVDYGETQTIPLQDVHPIDPVFLRVSAQAFQCCLFNLSSSSNSTCAPWSDAALAEFRNFVGANSDTALKCTVKALTSDEEGLPLNIVDIETPTDSACALLAQKCALTEADVPSQVPLDAYNYSTHDIEVGGKEKVFVTSSESVGHFYCQLVRNSHLLDKVMENVTQLTGQPQCTNHRLGLNSICLVRNANHQWCRGQIVEMSPTLNVHFVDYGETLAVNESDIQPFPAEKTFSMSVPMLAIPLGLLDVPGEVPQEVNQWFADCATGQRFTISVVSKEAEGKLLVELFQGSVNMNEKVRAEISRIKQQKKITPLIQQTEVQHSVSNGDDSVQDLGNVSGLTKITEQNKVQSSNGICLSDEFKMNSHTCITNVDASDTKCGKEGQQTSDLNLEDEKNVNICMYKRPSISQNKKEVYASCIVGPHYFWCQTANNEDLDMLSVLAQEVGQTQLDMSFVEPLGPGSPCLALFSEENQFYRAQVIHRTDNSFHVLFIDYGNESDIDVKNVRSLPQSLLDMAPQAFLCSLDGFDESKGSWDDQVHDDFYNLLVDKPLRVTVINSGFHSEIAVPQYAVQVECENVVVNNAMQKYWRPVAKKHVLIDSVPTEKSHQGGQTESRVTHNNFSERKVIPSTYKSPNVSKNQMENVYASCIVDPKYFWCQYANTEELTKLSALVQVAGQTQQDMMLSECLGPGSPCLALFSDDNHFYRAQVLHRTDKNLHVLFIDYGNESDVDIKNVRSLPQSLLDMAPQAFLCSLDGFDESKGSWDDQVHDDFYNLLVDKPLRVMVLNSGFHTEIAVSQYAVQIKCEDVAVNNAMQKYWKAFSTEPVMTESRPIENPVQGGQTESSLIYHNASKGQEIISMYKRPNISKKQPENVYASCIVGPKFFWCQYANTEDLSKLSTLVQVAGQTQQDMMLSESLGPGSPCLALFSDDNHFYRAQVLHRTDKSLHVLFIDYGNESDVDIKNVRPLPQNLLDMAPQAFLCSLNGFDESKGSWDDQVHDDFYNLLVDKPLRVTVINMAHHPEMNLPQYAVAAECEGVDVNRLIKKYWKRLDTDHASA